MKRRPAHAYANGNDNGTGHRPGILARGEGPSRAEHNRPGGVGGHLWRALGYRGWRIFEIVVSLTVLVVFAPLLVVVAILVRLDSPGPVLYLGKRVGLDRKPFHLVKFRTHYQDAAERFPELSRYEFDQDEVGNVRIQFEGDPRITRVGHWLRCTSIDELPNFWNVLKGEMTFVGPRPELWSMLPYYSGVWLDKFTVRPGITGWAQVRGRGNLTVAETNDLDIEYVRNRSVALDIRIVLETIWQVCCQRDAL